MSANDYSRGLAKANKSIKLLQRIFGKKSRKITEMNHDKADRKMYQAMDIVSEYFYFIASFNFISLFDVLFAAVGSFLAALSFVPPETWALVIYAVFRIIAYLDARRIVEEKLIPHDEKMVDSDTGVFTLILGKMRGGKTTLATAFGRIVNTIYHRNAFDNMNRVSLMPYLRLLRSEARATSLFL